MKTIRLLFVLALSIEATHAAEKEVKLLGVTSGFGLDSAVIGIWDVARNVSKMTTLKIGQEIEGIEMVRIEAAKGEVSLKMEGRERQVSMPANGDPNSTNELDPLLPVMYFSSLPLQSAMMLYADCKKRTVLIHPQLGTPTFSLKINPRTQGKAVEAWEKLLHEQNIATIPDGEHFVMVVPYSYTNAVTPRADTLPKTNSLIPAMSVMFRDAPMGSIVQTYADFMGKDIKDRQSAMNLSCCSALTFYQETPLSRAEIVYALETQLAWHKLRFVPEGDGLKLESIR